ncbi:hypothetical protein [Parageobacillus thermoglucosidasius]|uniref:Uncharacterized protein n=1 Tax=Parageobacillus thermoglucosidasius TaxID=1426 RepID=A0A1B7KP89_PARTM|nr:hypothetical protein [Parageobacillus thermoglucosidasius]OAT71893.1 hypothetical protein A7K69_10810 [Parageobacillus thermoglucosidasius]
MNKNSAEGLWNKTYDAEMSAVFIIRNKFQQIQNYVKDLYECGVELFTLDKQEEFEVTETLRIAAILLKRCLTDFRVLWNLLLTGYTPQAGSIAASLFETALSIPYLLKNREAIQDIKNNNGDIPWKVPDLCKNIASIQYKSDKYQYELGWREIYAAYKWLCKIKHPTLRSTLHEGLSTSIRENEFVVMAIPDIRQEDLAVKMTILTISISRLCDAVFCIHNELKLDKDNERYKKWLEKINAVPPNVGKIYKKITKIIDLPFTIGDEKISRDYKQLRKNKS